LQWELLQHSSHNGMQEWVRQLNHLYKNEPALHQWQFDKKGFQWEDLSHSQDGIMIYRRMCKDKTRDIVVIVNVSNQAYFNWEITLKGKSDWKELLNSDDICYWGSGNAMNINIPVEQVDKKKKLYKIKINISSFTTLLIQ
jgi:1,4-alpha-glucan branching enzyme